jgi:hypothetical protein
VFIMFDIMRGCFDNLIPTRMDIRLLTAKFNLLYFFSLKSISLFLVQAFHKTALVYLVS